MLDPHITKPTYMTGYTVTPDQITEIHHAQIFHIDAAQAKAGEQLERPGRQAGLVVLRRAVAP